MQNAHKMIKNEISESDFTEETETIMTQPATLPGQLKLAIAIATSGRREVLSDVLAFIARQTRLPDKLFICPAHPSDVDEVALATFPAPTSIVMGEKGLCAQRNTILKALTDFDVVIFFDDDYLPQVNFLAETEQLFIERPDMVMVTGQVLVDGITGPGISYSDGQILLKNAPPIERKIADIYNGYGCNMAIRLAPVHANNIRFDEKLPLYGWLEDVDFSRSVSSYGRIMKAQNLQGVHLATKRGRTSGVKFGYSQIANPLYMARKGTLSWPRAMKQIGRNLGANFFHVFAPEAWIDRAGRVKGNLLGIRDLLIGKLHPQRMLDLN